MNEQSNQARIAKNVVFLYIRMLLVMLVSLFTVRIVLRELGAEDYGIYTIIAGVVSMLALLSGSMTSATQRFFSYELGKNNILRLNQFFSLSLLCYIIISLASLIIFETIGLYFINNSDLKIPIEKMPAANIIYQFAIFTFIANLIVVPYNSLIIAYERMNVYAIFSIVEVIMKLGVVYLLSVFHNNRLILYGLFIFCITLISTLFYVFYCKIVFKQVKPKFFWQRDMFNDLMGYSLWNLFGSIATILKNQGINVLLGMFFSPVIVAARAIAQRVSSSTAQLYTNFFKAVKPQIVKQYASSNFEVLYPLLYSSSRLNFFLCFILVFPFYIECEPILQIWLESVPDYTMLFLKLVLINSLIDCMATPLLTAVQATGKIRNYQIITGGLLLLNIPASYIFLKIGFSPEVTIYVSIVISILAMGSRVIFVKKLIGVPVLDYFKKVLSPICLIIVCSSCLIIPVKSLFTHSFSSLAIVVAYSIVIISVLFYLIGLERNEKQMVLLYLKKMFNKLRRS